MVSEGKRRERRREGGRGGNNNKEALSKEEPKSAGNRAAEREGWREGERLTEHERPKGQLSL